MATYKKLTDAEKSSLTWKNNVTRLNEGNLNNISRKLIDASDALADTVSEVNLLNRTVYGEDGKTSLVDKTLYNSYHFLGYCAEKPLSDENGKISPIELYRDMYFDNPLSALGSDLDSLTNLVTSCSYDSRLDGMFDSDSEDEFDEKSYWIGRIPNSQYNADPAVFTNQGARMNQYGALAKLNFFNDVLLDHHRAIKLIGDTYKSGEFNLVDEAENYLKFDVGNLYLKQQNKDREDNVVNRKGMKDYVTNIIKWKAIKTETSEGE